MEKFSSWRDPATGIAPFIPAIDRSYNVVIGTAKLVVLLPFILVVSLLNLVVAVPRLVLMLANITKITVEYSSGDNRWRHKALVVPKPGDLIVSNFVSPADSLVYASALGSAAIYVVPSVSTGSYHQLTASQIQSLALSSPSELKGLKSAEPLDKIVSRAKNSRSIVVVFAESTTSNGKGLLKLASLPLDELAESTKVFSSAVKYTPSTVTTPIPNQSYWSWWFRCIARLDFVTVRVCLNSPVPANQTSMKRVAEKICEAGKLTMVGFGPEDKQEFYDAWKQIKGRK